LGATAVVSSDDISDHRSLGGGGVMRRRWHRLSNGWRTGLERQVAREGGEAVWREIDEAVAVSGE
jgi:hypothetical protein